VREGRYTDADELDATWDGAPSEFEEFFTATVGHGPWRGNPPTFVVFENSVEGKIPTCRGTAADDNFVLAQLLDK